MSGALCAACAIARLQKAKRTSTRLWLVWTRSAIIAVSGLKSSRATTSSHVLTAGQTDART